jgi:hypothetical protein
MVEPARRYTPRNPGRALGLLTGPYPVYDHAGTACPLSAGGKLLRISAEEVARCESQGSSDTGESTPSDSSTPTPDNDGASWHGKSEPRADPFC